MAPTLIGIVGYSPVVEAYPLGPRLMVGLERKLGRRSDVVVENMTWSPIHIVQRFQDEGAVRPRRLVLVGAASICEQPGRVRAFQWLGGTLPARAIHERVYEAVTGIVDIENTLMIGTHFEIWPGETYTVEVEFPADTFGRMVIADSLGTSAHDLADELGFLSKAAIAMLVKTTVALALRGEDSGVPIVPKSAGELVEVVPFIRSTIADTA
jgi:hypothetical protein